MLLKPLDRGGALYIDEKREVLISVIENRFEECSADLSGASNGCTGNPNSR